MFRSYGHLASFSQATVGPLMAALLSYLLPVLKIGLQYSLAGGRRAAVDRSLPLCAGAVGLRLDCAVSYPSNHAFKSTPVAQTHPGASLWLVLFALHGCWPVRLPCLSFCRFCVWMCAGGCASAFVCVCRSTFRPESGASAFVCVCRSTFRPERVGYLIDLL